MSDEIQRECDDEVDDEGYTIQKQLILEAWARFRPVNKTEEVNGLDDVHLPKVKPRTQTKKIKDIFGKIFTARLMESINLVLYNFVESETQIRQKSDFKNEFRKAFSNRIAKYMKVNSDADSMQEERAKAAPAEELDLVSDFLQMFVIIGTSAKKRDQIDLKLTLKALPVRIDKLNVHRVMLYDFKMIQYSLIAFQNANQD